jgi:hypothetical protein
MKSSIKIRFLLIIHMIFLRLRIRIHVQPFSVQLFCKLWTQKTWWLWTQFEWLRKNAVRNYAWIGRRTPNSVRVETKIFVFVFSRKYFVKPNCDRTSLTKNYESFREHEKNHFSFQPQPRLSRTESWFNFLKARNLTKSVGGNLNEVMTPEVN